MTKQQDTQGAGGMQPTPGGHTADWTEAAEALCQVVEKRIEATARKAAESLYEGLLYDTQEYLRENVDLNLKGEIENALGDARRAREALNAVAAAAGIGVQAYYSATAEKAVDAIWRTKARADLVPDLLEALQAQEDRYQRGILNMTEDEIDRVNELRRTALAKATGQ